MEEAEFESSFGDGPDEESEAGAEPDELVGTVLDGRFEIESLIGEGGMGRVYRGSQLSVDRNVAIKVLHGELSINDELKKRFFREAKVVSGFTHPNIVRLIDFGKDEEYGLLYLVMELIQGINLDELLEHGRMRPELALRIAYQTAGALVEAHGAGVIHRDLKAENLLLAPVADGTLQTKVVDFGIAYPEKASEKLTRTGRIYGTASYMAPEQAQGREVDRRADLFSLGVLMFEMLTGKLPIEGTSSIEVMIKQIQEGPPPLSDVLPQDELPNAVFQIVDTLLAGDPQQRPSDASAVREELEQIFRETGWQPIRLDTERPTVEMFEPWMQPPVEVSEDQAIERPASGRGANSKVDTPRIGPENSEVESNEPGSGEASPSTGSDGGGTEPESGPEVSGGGPAGGEAESIGGTAGGAEPQPVGEPEVAAGGSDSNRSLLTLAIILGVILVVLIPVAAYVGTVYFRPESGSFFTTGSSDGGGIPRPAIASPSADEDPVCGKIDRADLPKGWRGSYRPREGDSDAELLKVGKKKVHARWEGGGATLWIAKGSEDGGTYQLDCGHFTGSGGGDKCSGTLRRTGPVLILRIEGTEACEEYFSGGWVQD